MSNGIRALRKIQLGHNTSSDSGDIIPATTIWRGMGTIQDDRQFYFVPEDVGMMGGTDRSNVSFLGASISLDAVDATPEQLPILCELNIANATPTSDTGDGWIYTYPFPSTSQNTFYPYTLEGGDNNQAEVVDFLTGQDFTISGEGQKAVMMSGNCFGRQVQKQPFTNGVSLPAVTPFNFSMSKLFIDADSDAFGTTLISNTLLKATFKYTSMIVAKPSADGALYFAYVVQTGFAAQLQVTFEHNSNAVAAKDDWIAQNGKMVQWLLQGNTFTNPGTYDRRVAKINLAGKWSKFNKLGEMNGNDILEGTFDCKYNSTAATNGQIVVVNSLPALL